VKRLFLVVVVAALATPSHAQDAPPPPPPEGGRQADSVTIGIGAGYLTDYEGSDDYRFSPVPGAIGSLGGFSFVVAGNRASIDLIPNRAGPGWDVQAGPIGVINFNRSSTSMIDDPRVRALGGLGTAIELGGFVGIGRTGVITSDYDQLAVSVSYRKDVAGVHESGILQPTISYATPLSTKAAIGLIASAERAERGYGRTYFDVLPGQVATSGLPVFTTRGGWKHWQLGTVATVSLTGDLLNGWKLVAGGSYRRMLNDFGDSPIVSVAGSRGQWLGALGVGYTF
jgi:outer membrane scaffolding protein for murein synthesis (MipA/OmpV family)